METDYKEEKMTNRILAIAGFVIFIGLLIYGIESVKNEIRSHAFLTQARTTTSTASAVDLTVLSAYLYALYNEINYSNTMAREVAVKQYPELKNDLEYYQFMNTLVFKRSTPGIFKHRPLREQFKENYDALVKRYGEEHPEDKQPIE
jgi:hypothetical protein